MTDAKRPSGDVTCRGELTVNGVLFQWWAIGERPSLVTVRASFFGSLKKFTYDADIERFAFELAKRLFARRLLLEGTSESSRSTA